MSFLLLYFFYLFFRTDGSAIFNTEEWIPVPEPSSASDSSVLKPYPPISLSWKDSDTKIFVAIASFRDNRCPVTLQNLFSKAKYPDRLHIGLVQQVHTEQDHVDCISAFCALTNGIKNCPLAKQIQTVTFSFLDARGPGFARTLQGNMRSDEEFCLQLDSHSDVVQGWDEDLMHMWSATQNEFAVLSTFPPDVSQLTKNNEAETVVPHLCQATFNNEKAKDLQSPILSPLWSGAFSFSKCHAEEKVPSDSSLLYLYDGEEFGKFARLWTRGYDVYTPSRSIVFHDSANELSMQAKSLGPNQQNIDTSAWSRMGMTKEYKSDMYSMALSRVKTLLGLPGGDKSASAVAALTRFGLGTLRTLDELIDFTGIDLRSATVYADRCKPLQWSAYSLAPNANTGVIDPDVDPGDVWYNGPQIRSVATAGSLGDIPLIPGEETEKARLDGSDTVLDNGVAAEAVVISASNDPGSSAGGDALLRGGSISNGLSVPSRSSPWDGELWWVFQPIDSAVESAIAYIDARVGQGHGRRVFKLILLTAPVFVGVISAAIVVITSSSSQKHGGGDRLFFRSASNVKEV